MRSRLQILVLVLVLLTSGIGLSAYKYLFLDFTWLPDKLATIWQVQGRILFDAEGGPVKVSMTLPVAEEYRRAFAHTNIADCYRCEFTSDGTVRKAVWTCPDAEGPQFIYYRGDFFSTGPLKVQTNSEQDKPPDTLKGSLRDVAQDVIKVARQNAGSKSELVLNVLSLMESNTGKPDVRSLLHKVRFRREHMEQVARVLATDGIYAKAVRGLRLSGHYTQRSITTFLQAFLDDQWVLFDPNMLTIIPDNQVLLWPEGTRGLLDVTGAYNYRVDLSVSSTRQIIGRLPTANGSLKNSMFAAFSVYSLPDREQGPFKFLLMIPVGALIVVVMRNLVGIQTAGTFMPILIALTFIQTKLVLGILLLLTVVCVGLAMRFYLSHLKLLLVPRIASVLIFVIITLASIGIVSQKFGWEAGLAVTYFPMIIVSWAIERMSILWEETGPKEVLIQGTGSLFSASLAYLVMSNIYIAHCMYNFPELLLVLLAIMILIGKYSGYRLTELGRFEPMTRVL